MQENQLPQTEVNQSFGNSDSTNDQRPKNNNFLVILLSVLLIISVAISGFFAFQTQKLVKELTELKVQEKVVAVATTEPIATESSAVDPIANWKLVSNKFWTFKIPSNQNYIKCSSGDIIFTGSPTVNDLFEKDQTLECNFGMMTDLFNVYRALHNSQNDIAIPTNTDPAFDPLVSSVSKIKVDNKNATLQKETISSGQGTGTRYKIYIDSSQYTDVITFNDISQKELMDQILSTFKFLE